MSKNFNFSPITAESKFGYFEVFNDKSITKGFHSMSNHTLDKKYEAKIPLSVVDTILIDNGQFLFWAFTDKTGYVMKKSMKKLNRDYIMPFLINFLSNYLKTTEGIQIKKTETQLIWDVNKYASILSDRKSEQGRIFTEFETMYLEKFNSLKFILLHYSSTDKRFYNIFQFKEILDDTSLLAGISMIQFYFYANLKNKPIICKYTRKSILEARKFILYTEKHKIKLQKKSQIASRENLTKITGKNGTVKKVENVNLIAESEDESKEELILHNNDSLRVVIQGIVEPMIKLIEKSKGIMISEAHFQFIKVKEYNFVSDFENKINITTVNTITSTNSDNKNNNSYKYSYCSRVSAMETNIENYMTHQSELKDKMSELRLKRLPKELLYSKETADKVSMNLFTGHNSNNKPSQGSNSIIAFERISEDAFCFGEFCDFVVPKLFKNLKKTKEAEINTSAIPSENKFSERDNKHNLPKNLPMFIIKKAYDNPNMVNIVLKAYSVYPSNFDKDQAIREMNRIQRDEEEKKKEEDRNTNSKRRLSKGPGTVKFPDINNNESAIKSFGKVEKKELINLYFPTPKKFTNLNYDNMYSHKSVCNNCFIIYNLIQNFISNIDETTAQFKSLSKAKAILNQVDKLKNPNASDDSYIEQQQQNESFLFQEENNQFNLKSLLKKKIHYIKNEAMMKLIGKVDRPRITKTGNSNKEKLQKIFSYNININPKMLKLSLIAEKTKNKFFNLIFDELRTKPESIYQKLGIKKPDATFNRSMATLRMHMGLNSSSYNVNSKELNLLNKQMNSEVIKDFLTNNFKIDEVDENNSRNNINNILNGVNMSKAKNSKNAEKEAIKLQEIRQIDVDIFIAFRNLFKSKFGISPFINPSKKNSKRKESFVMIVHSGVIGNQRESISLSVTGRKRDSISVSLTGRNNLDNKFDDWNTTKDQHSANSNSCLTDLKEQNSEENEDNFTESEYNSESDSSLLSNSFVQLNRPKKDLSHISESIISISEHDDDIVKEPISIEGRIKFEEPKKEKVHSRSLYDPDDHEETYTKDVMHSRRNCYSVKESRHFIYFHLNKNINDFEDSYTTKYKPLTRKDSEVSITRNRRSVSSLSLNNSKGSININNDSKNIEMAPSRFKNQSNDNLIQNLDKSVSVNNNPFKRMATKTNFDRTTPDYHQFKRMNSIAMNKKSVKETNKKTTVSSIFYYDWSKDIHKIEINHYYYITSPLTKFNEMNVPITENPLILTRQMTVEEFIKVGGFEISNLFLKAEVFVLDQFTAVPFKVINLKKEKKENVSDKSKVSSPVKNSLRRSFIRRGSTAVLKEGKASKCLVIFLNDFFDSFTRYQETMTRIWVSPADGLTELKLVFLNLPGQSHTLFTKKSLLNNMYYSEFLDRFLFHLMEIGHFDHTYHIMFVGFGNGGQIALTYASMYEKYWDFVHSIILFNSFCENDEFINKSMLEMLKNIESSKNAKLVDFFIKSVTVNPEKLLNIDTTNVLQLDREESFVAEDKDKDNPNPITMTGYHNITKGYFFNVKINHAEIQTPMVVIHSNQNCFITLNNINRLFGHVKNKTFAVTKDTHHETIRKPIRKNKASKNIVKEIEQRNMKLDYNYDDMLPASKIKRKLIIIEGSHDIFYDNNMNIENILHSYMKYMIQYSTFGK